MRDAIAGRRRRGVAAVVAVALLAGGAARVAADSAPAVVDRERRRVVVDATFDQSSRRIAGTVEVELGNHSGVALERAYLWLYPNRFAAPPPGLDDVEHYWVYPRRFNPGSMTLGRVVANGRGARVTAEPHAVAGAGTLVSLGLAEPVAPGARLRLHLEFETHVPERYGALGCALEVCTLAAFHPLVAALGDGGWDLEAPVPPAALEVSLGLAEPAGLVVLDEIAPGPTTSLRAAGIAEYATAVVADRFHVSRRQVGGDELRVARVEAPPPPIAGDVVLPYTREDYAAMELDVAEAALGAARAAGHDLGGRDLTVVEVPLRAELAAAHPGLVLVSDRFARLWPARRFRKLHDRQLARAVYVDRLAPRVGPSALGRFAVADLVAAYLTGVFTAREHQVSEFVDDILDPVSFVPLVDQLLYAQETLFSRAYFGGVHRGGPSDAPLRFASQRPRGRFLFDKLRDLLPADTLARLMAELGRGRSLEEAADDAYAAPMEWFFRQWSLPPARVDLQLVEHTSTPAVGGFRHRIVVARRTAAGDPALIEPVFVLAVDAGGSSRLLRWDGVGERAVLGFTSRAPLARVVVDPDGRVEQRAMPGDGQDPRHDDEAPRPLRFVYNSFGVLLNVSDFSALLAADFSLGRVHDRRHETRFLLYTSASTPIGGGVGHRIGFGPAVTPDRLLGEVTASLRAARLDGDYFGGDDRGAGRVTLGVGVGASDRRALFEPMWSRALGLGASVSVTRRDALGDLDADYLVSGGGSLGLSRTLTPRAGHTLAAELSVAAVVGDLASRSQLVEAGGITGVRGFAPGTLFGRSVATGRFEYRHVFVHDLDWNWGFYTFVRGLGGAAFADVAFVGDCGGYDPSAGRFVASAGYGLRSFYDSFGSLPAMLRLDAAVGLSAGERDCLGAAAPYGRSVQVYLSFLPPF